MDVLLLIFYLVLLFIVFFVIRHFLEHLEISDLENKAVYITGCDSGFGQALAVKCLERGMTVFAGCLTSDGVLSIRKSASLLKGELTALQVDVTSDESVEKAKELLEKETQKYGGLHGVVNNAGIVGNTFYDDMLSIDDYKKTSEVNLWGVVRTTQATKSLVKKTKGRVVTVASICGRVGLPALGPYTVSKFGVEGYCDVIRNELRPFGVSVHVLEPGFFRTPLLNQKDIEESLNKVWKNCSPAIKEEYGEEFFYQGRTKSSELLDFISSDHVEWVVDAYFHALTARFPRLRYQIGWDCKLIFIPLSLLPSSVFDLVIQLSQFIARMPTPASLKKQQ